MSTVEKDPRTPTTAWSREASRLSPSPAIRDNLRVYVPLIGLIVLLTIVTSTQNPAFLTTGNFQRILIASATLGILAIGQTFLLVGGQFDLSVGSMVSLFSVIVAMTLVAGWPEPLVIAFIVGLGALIGLGWGVMVASLRIPPFILTLGGLSVFSSVALTLANNRPIGLPQGMGFLRTGTWLGLRPPVVIWLGLTVLGGILLHYTRFGRNAFALGASEQAAYLSGVPTRRTKVLLFVLNSSLASIAGLIFFARIGAGDPRGGLMLELITIAAIVLGGASLGGGRGTILGSFLAVLVLGFVSSSLTFSRVPDSYNNLVFGGVLIAAVTVTAVAEIHRERTAKHAPPPTSAHDASDPEPSSES